MSPFTKLQSNDSHRNNTRDTQAGTSLASLMQPEVAAPGSLQNAGNGRECELEYELACNAPNWAELERSTIYSRFGRRCFDLGLLAIFGLPALLIGLGIAAINVVQFRSVRKIFFVQERVGLRGKVFSIYKFRTMGEYSGGNYKAWGSGDDKVRVTRIGRLLRNTHLDELPQLINVALGDMAFVGPRPEMVEIEEWAVSEIEGFATRLAVPPGISGYAQITQGYTGSDVEAYEEKFRISDWYRRHQSFGLDLKIIALTLIWMVRGRGWDWNGEGVKPKVQLPD